MPRSIFSLTTIDSDQLTGLLRNIHRDEIECPLTTVGLTCVGLQEKAAVILDCLRGLDKAGVHAVLVAVLAERKT